MSKVGTYKIDITPPIGIDFIGYHRPNGIRNIDEQIYLTAFVFEYQESKSVFISIDNIGMLIEDTKIIRNHISKELNIPFEKITVVFTHTHSGPATASSNEVVQSYKNFLISQTIKAAVLANENMESSKVGWDVTTGDIGVNRREMCSNGKVKMGTNISGVVDHRVGLLAIKHSVTARLQGLIVFCTAHPNVLMGDSDRLSADYPGLTRKILEGLFDCSVIIVQGAAGNVNAKYRGSNEDIEKMAYSLSASVEKMIPDINYSPINKLRTISTTLSMHLIDIPEPSKIRHIGELAKEQWGVNTDLWQNVLMERFKNNNRNISIELEVQSFQLNEGSFSGIPMEPFAETAIEIKGQLKNELTFFGGYTNGYLGYLPTKEAYAFGGYEVELNPVVYGPITKLWMPPIEETAEQVAHAVVELHKR